MVSSPGSTCCDAGSPFTYQSQVEYCSAISIVATSSSATPVVLSLLHSAIAQEMFVLAFR